LKFEPFNKVTDVGCNIYRIIYNQIENNKQAKLAQINLRIKVILNSNKGKSHYKISGIH